MTMESITLNKIHEDEFKLSEDIKKQILESRKIPMFQMISQEEVEREFL